MAMTSIMIKNLLKTQRHWMPLVLSLALRQSVSLGARGVVAQGARWLGSDGGQEVVEPQMVAQWQVFPLNGRLPAAVPTGLARCFLFFLL